MAAASFEWSVSVGDVVAAASVLVGVLLAWWQLRKTNQQGRAELIVGLMAERARSDDALDLLYRIDYQRFVFDEQSFLGSKDEKALDTLLHSFSQVACLYQMGTLTRRDLALVEYDFLRVYCDPEVQKYFAYLDRTPHGLPTDEGDFRSFRLVAGLLIDEYRLRHSATGLPVAPSTDQPATVPRPSTPSSSEGAV